MKQGEERERVSSRADGDIKSTLNTCTVVTGRQYGVTIFNYSLIIAVTHT